MPQQQQLQQQHGRHIAVLSESLHVTLPGRPTLESAAVRARGEQQSSEPSAAVSVLSLLSSSQRPVTAAGHSVYSTPFNSVAADSESTLLMTDIDDDSDTDRFVADERAEGPPQQQQPLQHDQAPATQWGDSDSGNGGNGDVAPASDTVDDEVLVLDGTDFAHAPHTQPPPLQSPPLQLSRPTHAQQTHQPFRSAPAYLLRGQSFGSPPPSQQQQQSPQHASVRSPLYESVQSTESEMDASAAIQQQYVLV